MIAEIDTDSSGTVDFDGEYLTNFFTILMWRHWGQNIAHIKISFRSKVLEKCSLIMSEEQSNQFSYERNTLDDVRLLIIYEHSSHIFYPHTSCSHNFISFITRPINKWKCKECEETSLLFDFTNYESRKAKQLTR